MLKPLNIISHILLDFFFKFDNNLALGNTFYKYIFFEIFSGQFLFSMEIDFSYIENQKFDQNDSHKKIIYV